MPSKTQSGVCRCDARHQNSTGAREEGFPCLLPNRRLRWQHRCIELLSAKSQAEFRLRRGRNTANQFRADRKNRLTETPKVDRRLRLRPSRRTLFDFVRLAEYL